MSLGDPLVDYCERLGPGLLAEPLNALSNLAFFYAALRLWRGGTGLPAPLAGARHLLAALLALVGLGSLAFHTLATRGTGILDVACIGVFNLAYLVLFVRLVARRTWPWALGAGAAFVALDRLAGTVLPAEAVNGSLLYVPALLALLILTGYGLRHAPRSGRMMLGAASVFCVSLLLRSVDRALCPAWPWGTHFAWHVLNAWVLFRLGDALVRAAGASGRGVDGAGPLAAVLDPAPAQVLVQAHQVVEPRQIDGDPR